MPRRLPIGQARSSPFRERRFPTAQITKDSSGLAAIQRFLVIPQREFVGPSLPSFRQTDFGINGVQKPMVSLHLFGFPKRARAGRVSALIHCLGRRKLLPGTRVPNWPGHPADVALVRLWMICTYGSSPVFGRSLGRHCQHSQLPGTVAALSRAWSPFCTHRLKRQWPRRA